MSDMLVFSIDTESEAGGPIAQKFNVRGLPALIFLEPDGTVRDLISGYLPPDPFIGEVRRIKSGKGTLSDFKRKIDANPDDLEARYAYAEKLASVGDQAGAQAQREEIAKRDPEGKSVASRRLRFDQALAQVQGDLNAAPIYALAEKESDPELLFQMWNVIWQVEELHANSKDADDATRAEHRAKWLAAGRTLWSHVSDEDVAALGNRLAWSLWEAREHLSDDDKAFALTVAMKTAQASPEDASVLDTYACTLYMNGKLDEAVATIKKAIALDPDNDEWQARLTMFETGA